MYSFIFYRRKVFNWTPSYNPWSIVYFVVSCWMEFALICCRRNFPCVRPRNFLVHTHVPSKLNLVAIKFFWCNSTSLLGIWRNVPSTNPKCPLTNLVNYLHTGVFSKSHCDSDFSWKVEKPTQKSNLEKSTVVTKSFDQVPRWLCTMRGQNVAWAKV